MPDENSEKPGEDVYEEFIATFVERVEAGMRKELGDLKAQFLEKARKYEEERLKEITDTYRNRLQREVEQLESEIEHNQRIINIQAALLSRLIEENRSSVLKVLENADLSEDDLLLLSGEQRMVRER
jgi:hypothetical protein